MRVAIVGFETEGKSAYSYWQKQGAEITVCDQNPDKVLPSDVQAKLGDNYLQDLQGFDIICRTAGINPNKIYDANPALNAAKVTTVINEFLRVCPTKNVIGITGTKGKGTTSSLTTKILEAAGKAVFLGGNIGNSPLDFLSQLSLDSWVVLELSSFQLQDLKRSPHISVCLMVAPEHLNWHEDMGDYEKAKSQLFAHQAPEDIAIYFANNETSHRIASSSPGAKITYFAEPGAYVRDEHIIIDNQQICHVNELQLIGKHNWENVCAAVTAAWQVTQDVSAIRSALTLFSGLEHRLEFVREVDDVRYYNDSFGTTPETAIVALQAFPEHKIIILGGSDKGASFGELAKTVAQENVRQVITIGETAPAIEEALEKVGFAQFTRGGQTMDEIVHAAKHAAKKGDVVLLSPACASFGIFTDYKDRGQQFKLAVGAL